MPLTVDPKREGLEREGETDEKSSSGRLHHQIRAATVTPLSKFGNLTARQGSPLQTTAVHLVQVRLQLLPIAVQAAIPPELDDRSPVRDTGMLEANALDLNHRYAVYVLPVRRLLSASTVTNLSAATDPVARGDSRLDSGGIKDARPDYPDDSCESGPRCDCIKGRRLSRSAEEKTAWLPLEAIPLVLREGDVFPNLLSSDLFWRPPQTRPASAAAEPAVTYMVRLRTVAFGHGLAESVTESPVPQRQRVGRRDPKDGL
ncbi:hypothetical protein LA080_003698 [Diaporthe eres]|nr:hypothetical protein LA080_003698 [Diaporthe eres]